MPDDTAVAPDTSVQGDGQTAPSTATPAVADAPSAPALITTSSASRANYADNVTSLNTALANTSATPSTTQSVRYDGGNVYNQPDGHGGFYSGPIANAPGTLYNVPDGKGSFYTGPASGAPVVTTPPNTAPQGADNPNYDPNAAPGTPGSSDPTGTSSPGTPPDASGAGAGASDPQAAAVASLPPSISSMFKDAFAAQDQAISDAKTTLAAAAASVANDPAAAQAASAIAAKYDILINAMKEKNRQVLGGAVANAARSGGLQYANDMTESFMSAEMDRASQRISDLLSKEQDLILRSNNAYKNADIKAFDSAQKALEKAQKDKTDTFSKLLTATNNQVKAVQAQAKIDAATKKNALTTDTNTSKSIAAGMVTAIKAAGVTDPVEIQKYVEAMAEKNGITNPDILAGALATEQQKAAKTNYTINRPYSTKSGSVKKGGGTDGGYTYTADDIGTYTSLLNKGGTGPDGTKYAPRGDDTFVDPGAYVAAYKDWIKNNGTVAGFLKKFPISNVNPESIPNLPKGLQPKVKQTQVIPQ